MEVGHGADILGIVVGNLSARGELLNVTAEAAGARRAVVGRRRSGLLRESDETASAERGGPEKRASIRVHRVCFLSVVRPGDPAPATTRHP
ncbi:hypothetical protein GCM10007890_30050 [Methylobacterium tardum]|uniref:Uncharacterized protein n=1 Tax=Methylobacterium tardum TaxID=374432 RepID=A0AA37WT76_9HYPH|nr:hypothetical protein GCM10007890_30050 [Methylobacterium tardum]